jgi:hypothetical protein
LIDQHLHLFFVRHKKLRSAVEIRH